jgi:hypothetical protein
MSCKFQFDIRNTTDTIHTHPCIYNSNQVMFYKQPYIHSIKISPSDLSETTLYKEMSFIESMCYRKLLKHLQIVHYLSVFITINIVCVFLGCLSFICNVIVFLVSVDYPCVLSDYHFQPTYTKYCHIDLFGFYERNYYYGTPTERFMSLLFSVSLIGLSFICLSRVVMVWSGNS